MYKKRKNRITTDSKMCTRHNVLQLKGKKKNIYEIISTKMLTYIAKKGLYETLTNCKLSEISKRVDTIILIKK